MSPETAPGNEGGDAVLLRQFAARHDNEAIGALFSKHADAAYRVAWRYAGNESDAEDIVQTAFLQILRKPDQFRGESSVRAWIMGIVVNVSRMKFRGESRRREREGRAATGPDVARPPETSAADPSALDQRELQRVLLRAVESLPERYRLPLWLHYLEGFVFKDVATILDVPEKTIRSQIRRALIRLRRSPSVAGYSLSTLGVAAALSSIPCHAAPAAFKAAIPALVTAALPAATGAIVTAKLAALVTGALQVVRGVLLTKAALGVGTATVLTGGLVWWVAREAPGRGAPPAADATPVASRAAWAEPSPWSSAPVFPATPRPAVEDPAPIETAPVDRTAVESKVASADAGDLGESASAPTGDAIRLPLRDRARPAVRQSTGERCPSDYSTMYEQYLINISESTSSPTSATADHAPDE
jgi:RNA polymerase sigma-70 factor (ECF subfamily)